MKYQLFTLAALLLSASNLVNAACDSTTKVKRCDGKECTYEELRIPHYSDWRIDEWAWHSCGKPDDPKKCQDIKDKDGCLAAQCHWDTYQRRKKTDKCAIENIEYCTEQLQCNDMTTVDNCSRVSDYCLWDEDGQYCYWKS